MDNPPGRCGHGVPAVSHDRRFVVTVGGGSLALVAVPAQQDKVARRL
jgi:hypothetical protein